VRNSHPADAPSESVNVTVASHILHTQQGIRGLRHAKPPHHNGGSRINHNFVSGSSLLIDLAPVFQ